MLPPLLENFLKGPSLPSSFAPSCAVSNVPKNCALELFLIKRKIKGPRGYRF
ncbi:hypothetical protein S245_032831 [Arachis hypogaea]